MQKLNWIFRKEFESLGGVSRQNASLSLVRFSEKKEGQNGEENTKNLLKKNNRDEKIFWIYTEERHPKRQIRYR